MQVLLYFGYVSSIKQFKTLRTSFVFYSIYILQNYGNLTLLLMVPETLVLPVWIGCFPVRRDALEGVHTGWT